MLKQAQNISAGLMQGIDGTNTAIRSPFDLLQISSGADAEIIGKYDMTNISGAEYSSMLKELFAGGNLTFDELGSVYKTADFYFNSFDSDTSGGVPFSEDTMKRDLIESVQGKINSLDLLMVTDSDNIDELSRHKNILSSMLQSFGRLGGGMF
jgi:hypothetical protein